MNREKLLEKIKEEQAERDYHLFKEKDALYQDHFFDADRHGFLAEEAAERLDKLYLQLKELEGNNHRKGSYYIECMHCGKNVHQNRLGMHKCEYTPVTKQNLKLMVSRIS